MVATNETRDALWDAAPQTVKFAPCREIGGGRVRLTRAPLSARCKRRGPWVSKVTADRVSDVETLSSMKPRPAARCWRVPALAG